MDLTPTGHDKVLALLAKGVTIPNPLSLELADDVDVDKISGDGVTLHAGCRLRGASTVISAGCTLGSEGPVTLENCQLGPGVQLKGGYAADAVFLTGANFGLGHHIRGGSLIEEEAGGAHCVGLKQTILFPFATLGSLINFCDCLLSGGTSRSDHSEVGSSYIHFNFTPDGDKSTASLFGDVPRGVMLDQAPIFLGGQGGTVGPVTTGFGTVVGAGSILRSDIADDGHLVLEGFHRDLRRPHAPANYRGLTRVLERNIDYIGSLVALQAWYREVRRPFFEATELGPEVLAGALAALDSGRAERVKRLGAMIGKVSPADDGRGQLAERSQALIAACRAAGGGPAPEALTQAVGSAAAAGTDYLTAIRGLDAAQRSAGTKWLNGIVDELRAACAEVVPALGLFAA